MLPCPSKNVSTLSLRKSTLKASEVEKLAMKDNLQNINFLTNFRFYNKCFIYIIKANKHLNNCDCSGVAMARGILDSLMSATYFNASALRLLRQLVSLYFCPFLPTYKIYFWQPKPTFYPYAARFPWVLEMSLRLHLETSLKLQEISWSSGMYFVQPNTSLLSACIQTRQPRDF